MSTATIRAKLAARGVAEEPPFGCSWCGDEQHHHGSQWAPIIGMHQWMQPTQAAILERMRRRRANRMTAAPAQYHATTGWADDGSGESADPYCADCKTDGCRPWIRIQARLDEQRWGIPRNPRPTRGGWGGDAPW
ncbi:hypothetical protein ACWF8U_00800 [Streptomyces olivaceus]|uniref:hypothetical protein n=1 Tax=Streptomyces olivaceus TaxID=47716 RepID=UPI001CCC9386|nr:hypothetical protein [Streptomyces olivaceus]MBZ6207526.1 hypothetical protein [Streptomyces olivaceus]